jgi:hypothetical protein
MDYIKGKIKRIIYFIFQLFYYFRDYKNNSNIILVYSMGKVGSTSIYSVLNKRLPATDVFHVHFLSDYWLKEKLPKLDKYFHGNINCGNDILNHIKKNPKKRIKIITLVREPIIRDISDIFENWRSKYYTIENFDITRLSHLIEENGHEYTLTWFETEFMNYLGFNIYDIPFDQEEGYKIYNLKNVDILCLKLEMLGKISSKAFKEFLGIELTMINQNISSEKKGKELYLQLKNNYKANNAKLAYLYNSQYVKHFYTSKEIESFINNWRY